MEEAVITVRISVTPSAKAADVTQALTELGYHVINESEPDSQLDHVADAIREQSKKPLTPTEKLVLGQLLLGKNCREIAQALGKSPSVTKWHMSNIYDKTGAGGAEQVRRLAEGKLYKGQKTPPKVGEPRRQEVAA